MTESIHAIILGIVQGLTEFLPVSSSAHLNIFPWIFKWEEISESFDVALHLGTLLAVCLFFFKYWIALIKGGFKKVLKKESSTEGKIFWYLVIATIPAGILSLVLDKISKKIVNGNLNIEMLMISIALIVMGVILYISDKKCKSKVDYEHISLKQAILVGISQAIAAAFPGVSRSGITITVARMLKIDRESAAKFSFLLAAPIVFAAVLVDITKFTISPAFILGVLASFVSGIIVIKFLMDYLKKGSFKIFAIYRVILGLAVIAVFAIRTFA
ncbi:MAG: undecaprenyl-diphosphatase UppP [Clostridia bacterium]|nr:undecaprenyl-diphosphatase UppP [Clostridia bacterium]